MDINELRSGDAAGLTDALAAHADEHTRVTLHDVDTLIARHGASVFFTHGHVISFEIFPDAWAAQVTYLRAVATLREHQARHLRAYVAEHSVPDLHDMLGMPVPDYPPAG